MRTDDEYGPNGGRSSRSPGAMGAGMAAVVAGGLALAAIAVGVTRRDTDGRPRDSAARRLAHGGEWADKRFIAGKTVLINKPRAEVYAFYRDFSNLPHFMENIESVETAGNHSTWTIAAPGGQSVTIEAELTETRENEVIAWKSTGESQIEMNGRVTFRDAPAGRGTYVEAVINYKPPAGRAGQLVAKLFRRVPEIQARHEMKRLKMLLETGEIATSARNADENARHANGKA